MKIIIILIAIILTKIFLACSTEPSSSNDNDDNCYIAGRLYYTGTTNLYLGYKFFGQIPECLYNLKNLKYLDLTGNQLYFLSSNIDKLSI